MGIDVWFERPLADTIQADGQTKHEIFAENEHPGRVVTERRGSGKERIATIQMPIEHPLPDGIPGGDLVSAGVEPFSLVCVRGKGVVLLALAPLLRNQQRLARDIVLAAMRLRRLPESHLELIEYRYPPGADLGRDRVGSPARALRAFLSAQREGTAGMGGTGLILLTTNAHPFFRDWLTDPHLRIDDLNALAGDAECKRALWQQLRASI